MADDNISYRIWIGTIVPVVPATIITVMRFTARLVWQVGLWWDDYTIAVALVINWAMAATRWAQILMYDYGQHTQFVPYGKVANFQKVCISSRASKSIANWVDEELPRRANYILCQCRVHQSLPLASLSSHLWCRFGFPLGSMDLGVRRDGILYSLCHCLDCWMRSCLVLLEPWPAGALHR